MLRLQLKREQRLSGWKTAENCQKGKPCCDFISPGKRSIVEMKTAALAHQEDGAMGTKHTGRPTKIEKKLKDRKKARKLTDKIHVVEPRKVKYHEAHHDMAGDGRNNSDEVCIDVTSQEERERSVATVKSVNKSNIKTQMRAVSKLSSDQKGQSKNGHASSVTTSTKPNLDYSTSESNFQQMSDCLQSSVIPGPEMCVALDCEFVGVTNRRINSLARCSVVDFDGHVLLDIYVYPTERITDFRTPWSGIRPSHMRNATPFCRAQQIIGRVIRDKIVVGHAVHNDFKVMHYSHPKQLVRDTSSYMPLLAKAGFPGPVAGLKKLTRQLRGVNIQRGPHCSVEDARATMALYKLVREEWEQNLVYLQEEFSPDDE